MAEHERGSKVGAGAMTQDRFAALVASYGANPSRWPPEERAQAQAFVASNSVAREVLADAAALDTTLDRLPTEDGSPALRARILSAFDALHRQPAGGGIGQTLARLRDMIWPGAPVWQPASAFALSLALGVAMGLFVPSAVSAQDNDPTANLLVVSPAVFDLDHGN